MIADVVKIDGIDSFISTVQDKGAACYLVITTPPRLVLKVEI